MKLSRAERWSVLYFGGHAVIDLLWWLAVASVPRFRGWFELDPSRRDVLNAFFLADMVILAGASFVAAFAVARRWRSALAWTGFVTGGSAYAALYLIGWVWRGGHGWYGAVAMTLETLAMVACVLALVRSNASASSHDDPVSVDT